MGCFDREACVNFCLVFTLVFFVCLVNVLSNINRTSETPCVYARSHARRVAVCVVGHLRGENEDVCRSFIDFVRTPLRAHVFVATTREYARASRCYLPMATDVYVGDLEDMDAVLRTRTAHEIAALQAMIRYYSLYVGNFLGGAMLLETGERVHDSMLIRNFYHEHCHRMIRRHEHATGRRYDAIVLTRSEFLWLAPHPWPLPLAGARVYIPGGMDWYGLNDRHILMSRAAAPSVLRRFNETAAGRWPRQCPTDTSPYYYMNGSMVSINAHLHSSEIFHLCELLADAIAIHRFEPRAFATCTSANETFVRAFRNCTQLPLSSPFLPTNTVVFKYQNELHNALATRALMRRRNSFCEPLLIDNYSSYA